jgi:hypothetical protein
MKKIFSFIASLCIALSVYAETEFTFTSSEDLNQTKDGISLVIAKGSGSNAPLLTTDYETHKPEMRLYLGNTITISGENLTNIQMVFAKSSASNKEYTGLSANTGELVSGGVAIDKNDWKVDKWTGSASSVEFTLTGKGQRRLQRILIDGDSITFDPEPELPTAEDLDPLYTYAEPTLVHVPDTQIFKQELAFIDNNILVHCDLGSIVEATDTTFAYFNCNAEHTITFTATQPMKGVSIDGYVRKAFNATCDHGTLQFLTDPDFEMEGWPALVILDIDNTSVTLTCPKQFRCYGAQFYFQENPDPLFEGIEQTQSTTPAAKMLLDGQLYIIKNGRTFTASGAEVK